MVIDYAKREVSIDNTVISLSKKEFAIVELLSANTGQVFTDSLANAKAVHLRHIDI